MNERSAETIITDWLMGFCGSDTIEEHRSEAQEVIRWLHDEEWDLIRREHLAALKAVAEAAREFIRLVDGVNQRPRKEGIEMRAVMGQGALRSAIDSLDATEHKDA